MIFKGQYFTTLDFFAILEKERKKERMKELIMKERKKKERKRISTADIHVRVIMYRLTACTLADHICMFVL